MLSEIAPPSCSVLRVSGCVSSIAGQTIHATLPSASIGDLCRIQSRNDENIVAEVIAFNGNSFTLAPFSEPRGIGPGSRVTTTQDQLRIRCSNSLLGKVVNCMGQLISTYTDHNCTSDTPKASYRYLRSSPPAPSERPLIKRSIETGVKAIDAFCTIGVGQRLGIFASAGVGKSSVLGMIAKHASADVIVIALVGERSREVREFAERTIGAENMHRVVIVAATSDEPSLTRQLAPYTATTIAEYFRDQGKDVLLMIDSLTRMARATRETSLNAGELPVRHGYTNSVYTELPKLLERAGLTTIGSITALCTVLTNEEEDVDPLADEIKSLLDGHIVLSKVLANKGVFPAIDLSRSISRLFPALHSAEYLSSARAATAAFTRLIKEKSLALLGGEPDPELRSILKFEKELFDLLKQDFSEVVDAKKSRTGVVEYLDLLSGEVHQEVP